MGNQRQEIPQESHFVILRGPEVSDILKPSYLYGGLPLTQLILERVYGAERTANEAPMLALTKRLVVRYMEDLREHQQQSQQALNSSYRPCQSGGITTGFM